MFHGEINAWRKGIVEADTSSLAEDLDMAISIRKQGYKIGYEPKALVYEAGPTTKEEQIVQKKRTTIGTIQNFFKHKKYLWIPKDKYSAFIFPSHKTLQLFSPFLLIICILSIIGLLFMQEFYGLMVFFFIGLIICVLSFLLLTKQLSTIKIKEEKIRISPIKKISNLLYYVFLHEWIILLAWRDFIFKRYSVLWDKAESTR